MTNSFRFLWEQPNWLEQASSWIDNQLHRLGIKRIGSIEQPHIRHWSTVLRVPTIAGNLYFKAVVPNLAYESVVTHTLSRWRPDCMPQVFATNTELGWLLMSDGGMRLRESLKADDDIRHWEALLPIYAELQKQASSGLDELLEIGVPDRRLAVLPTKFEELLDNTKVLRLDRQCGLSSLEYQYLRNYVDSFARLCEQLTAYRVPESLHHGDLHDGNIFVRDERYLFFDWGDSSVAHPFFSLRSTFVSLKKRFGLEEDSFWFERLKECYLEPWAEYESKERLEEAFKLAQGLSPILSALRWLPVLSNMDEVERSKYFEAIPNLLREFITVNIHFHKFSKYLFD